MNFKKIITIIFLIPIIGFVGFIAYTFIQYKTNAGRLVKDMKAAGQIEFLTLDAGYSEGGDYESETDGESDEPDLGYIGSFPILDSRIINDSDTIDSMLDGLLGETGGEYPSCFWPRHAIKMIGEEYRYIIICFECDQYRIPRANSGHPNLEKEAVLNQIADDLGMKRAPSPFEKESDSEGDAIPE
jgi:hypothetical protein